MWTLRLSVGCCARCPGNVKFDREFVTAVKFFFTHFIDLSCHEFGIIKLDSLFLTH